MTLNITLATTKLVWGGGGGGGGGEGKKESIS